MDFLFLHPRSFYFVLLLKPGLLWMLKSGKHCNAQSADSGSDVARQVSTVFSPVSALENSQGLNLLSLSPGIRKLIEWIMFGSAVN